MYVLLNKTLTTMPYKHPDPFVLCDMVLIEFPDDYVDIFHVENPRPLHSLLNTDLEALYCGLYRVPSVYMGRFEFIDAIMQFVRDAAPSVIGKYHAEYQAKGLEAQRTTRYKFTPDSFVVNLEPVSEPNRVFLAMGAAGERTGDAKVTTLATVPLKTAPMLTPAPATGQMKRPWE